MLHELELVDLAVADIGAPDHMIGAERRDAELAEVLKRRLIRQQHFDQERRVLVVDVVDLREREMLGRETEGLGAPRIGREADVIQYDGNVREASRELPYPRQRCARRAAERL